jgi:hypothetical protein
MIRAAEFEFFGEPSIRRMEHPGDLARWRMLVKERSLPVPQ